MDGSYAEKPAAIPPRSIWRTYHWALLDIRSLVVPQKLSNPISKSKQERSPKMQRGFICKCCPKIKKFNTQEQLKYATFKNVL
jgi:hypothetical protein